MSFFFESTMEGGFVPARAFWPCATVFEFIKAKNKGLTLQVWLESCMDAKQMT
jgi:hypothetical protein